jgi:hypothetical protein
MHRYVAIPCVLATVALVLSLCAIASAQQTTGDLATYFANDRELLIVQLNAGAMNPMYDHEYSEPAQQRSVFSRRCGGNLRTLITNNQISPPPGQPVPCYAIPTENYMLRKIGEAVQSTTNQLVKNDTAAAQILRETAELIGALQQRIKALEGRIEAMENALGPKAIEPGKASN